jgi:hypothetical protein
MKPSHGPASPPLVLLAALVALVVCARPTAQTLTDIATDATDPCNFTDSEPSIAVNPRNPQEIVILTFSEAWGPSKNSRTDVSCKPTGDEQSAPLWRSLDGGVTWRKEFVIPRLNSNQDGPADQRAAFDAAGRLLIAAMDQPGFVTRIYRQQEASAPVLLAGLGFTSDQPHLEVDRFAASRCLDRVYSPWNKRDNQPFPLSFVSNSSDRGARVTEVSVGNNNFPNRTARIAVAPDGAVYVVYKTQEARIDGRFQRARFRVVRSDDCGQTWGPVSGGTPIHGEATVTTWFTDGGSGFGNAAKGRTNRALSSDAWVAVDPVGGAVYVAYIDLDAAGFSQIVVARSDDRGSTWNSSRIPNEGRHCAYPEIAVAGNGVVGVLYVDMDDSGSSTIFRHRFARSFDQAATWPAAEQKTLQSMEPSNLDNDDNAVDDYIWGDYEGLTAEGDTFFGVFTGESINRQQRQLDPIFFKEPAAPTTAVSKNAPHPR